MDSSTIVLRNVLAIVSDLGALPHSGQVGRVLLAAAVATNNNSKGCNDDDVARAASMPVATVREIIPTMLVRCLHVPVLLSAKTNVHPMGTTYSGIRLTGEGSRRMRKIHDSLSRVT